MTITIMTLSKKGIFAKNDIFQNIISKMQRHDIQHNDTQHNDTQHKMAYLLLLSYMTCNINDSQLNNTI
jgi:hypothetical protein